MPLELQNVTNNDNKFCKRCHRRLKSLKAIEIGYGPICYSKIARNNSMYLFEVEEIKNVEMVEKKK